MPVGPSHGSSGGGSSHSSGGGSSWSSSGSSHSSGGGSSWSSGGGSSWSSGGSSYSSGGGSSWDSDSDYSYTPRYRRKKSPKAKVVKVSRSSTYKKEAVVLKGPKTKEEVTSYFALIKRNRIKSIIYLNVVIVLLFLSISIVMLSRTTKITSTMKLMKQDAREYAEIIDMCESNQTGYCLTRYNFIEKDYSNPYELSFKLESDDGKTASAWAYWEVKCNSEEKYYLIISFNHLGEKITGETYSCFSKADFHNMEYIDLCYTKDYDMDGCYDVVQADYSLDNNYDFKNVRKNRNKNLIITIVCFSLFVGAIVALFSSIKKSNTEKVMPTVKSDDKYCPYCNSLIPENATVCGQCGHSLIEEVK